MMYDNFLKGFSVKEIREDDIVLVDTKGNETVVDKYDNGPTQYTYRQIQDAEKTSKSDIEALRKSAHTDIVDLLKTDKEWNVIITPEGIGKSSLIPEYIKKFGADRIVLLMKSYEQVRDKKNLFQKYFPDLKVEMIPSNEKFLDKYNIFRSEWQYSEDKETGEKYVDLIKTIQESAISPSMKSQAMIEKKYFDEIIKRDIHIDIILMTEDKMRAEVLYKKNFTGQDELVCWDEFYPDNWFEWQHLPEAKQAMLKNIKAKQLIDFPTWSDSFNVRMMHENMWQKYMHGKKIILSTEGKCWLFFETMEDVNIVPIMTFFPCPNVNIHRVSSAIIRKKDNKKEFLASSLRANNYIVWGNGVKSKVNDTTMLGQNYHDRIASADKIVLMMSQPSPEQIAPLMKNLKINDYQATILYMTDSLNQYLGRCHGYRDIKYQSFDVIIPNKFADDILRNLRYICNIYVGTKDPTIYSPIKSTSSEPTMVSRIIHTISAKNRLHGETVKMGLITLIDKTHAFLNKLANPTGMYIERLKRELPCLQYYKLPFKMDNKRLVKMKARILAETSYSTSSLLYLYRHLRASENLIKQLPEYLYMTKDDWLEIGYGSI